MGMSREQKKAEVEELKDYFANDEMIVVAHYSGLDVDQMSELRANLREMGGRFKVTKNSLARIAIKGTKFEPLSGYFTGPTGIASSKDPVAAAKAAYEFSKDNDNLVILAGSLSGEILDVEGIETLAKLPGLDEIRSKLVGLVQAPATKLAGLMQAPARELVGVTAAYGAKGE